jgi:hypothetical protein
MPSSCAPMITKSGAAASRPAFTFDVAVAKRVR